MTLRNLFITVAAMAGMVASIGCGSSGEPSGENNPPGDASSADVSLRPDTGAGGRSSSDGSMGTDVSIRGDANGSTDAGACLVVGATCATPGDCCTANCDTQLKVCATSVGACRAAGASCTDPQDCCTFVCSGGVCGAKPCTSDNQACSSPSACCGGQCASTGVCTPLNTSCRTQGNTCTAHGDCCSKLCTNGVCQGRVSICTQNGEACAAGAECCGGICTKAQGATLGLCSQPSVGGASGCAVTGQVCGAGASGGPLQADAGIPSCGGECCSRACAPYRTGVLICQPPSGCRPTGEVCRNNFDCCGFGGVQGSTGVGSCNKTNPTDEVGRCDNGNACRPAGAVCKLATTTCNAENNCCAGNVNQNPLVCQQDLLGIPRCTMFGQSCADAGSKAGQRCATSADCCGLACTPNPSFDPTRPSAEVPPFICGGSCVGAGGDCSTTADCCPGLPCVSAPGSTRGKCGSVPPGSDGGMPPNPDAGTPPDPDGGVPPDPDGGVPPDPDGGASDDASPDGGVCSEYGQTCTESSNCCNYPSVMCTNGRCIVIIN